AIERSEDSSTPQQAAPQPIDLSGLKDLTDDDIGSIPIPDNTIVLDAEDDSVKPLLPPEPSDLVPSELHAQPTDATDTDATDLPQNAIDPLSADALEGSEEFPYEAPEADGQFWEQPEEEQ
ncbi:MAG: hypothetical protein KDB27_12435, partial [Planctomycetales bacterium]|nr:hypothetical protein [Planctomycetales bacterium]